MSRGEEIFAKASGWDLDVLKGATVLVAGVGALGNEVLKNLALLGAGRLVMVDFDAVERHNLSRSVLFHHEHAVAQVSKVEAAAQSLLRINPDLRLVILKGDLSTDLGLGLLQQANAAIGCLDNRLARLYLNRLCWKTGIPWVDGGILQLSGQVCAYVPGDSCYECQLSEGEWREIRQKMGCADVAQRFSHAGRLPTTPIAASIIGAVQVQETLKLIHLEPERRKGGLLFSYEGAALATGIYHRLELKPDCLAHFGVTKPVSVAGMGHFSSLGELARYCKGHLGMHRPRLRLGHDLIAVDRVGDGSADVVVPKHRLIGRVLRLLGLPETEGWIAGKDRLFNEIPLEDDQERTPLWRFGIPFGAILEVLDGSEKNYLLLEQDMVELNSAGQLYRVPVPWEDFHDDELRRELIPFVGKT